MKSVFILFILMLPSISQAQALCPQSNTTVEMNQCLNYKLETAVNELKNNLELIRIRFADETHVLNSINDAQLAWEEFRKTQCQSVFMLWQQASAQSLMAVSCSIQLARERNQFLRDSYLSPR